MAKKYLSKPIPLASLGMSAVAFAPLLFSAAYAQTATAPAQRAELEEIVVTASTGTTIRGVAPTGSAVLNISRDELVSAPVREASEIIAKLPQGSNLGFIEAPGGGGNNGRGSGVNLRGLGGNATLVLFDGHRLAGQGIINQFADPNQIPFAALERVEVVTDGASAIYGSAAVAGVVNYIMRRDYHGAEVTARLGHADVYNTKAIDAVAGYSWSSGNIMLGISAENRGDFLRGERSYLKQDLRPYGGNDNRAVGTTLTSGSPGNIIIGQTVYGLPRISSGIPTAAQVIALQGNPNLVDSADYISFLPERTRVSGVLRARYQISDAVEATYTALASKRNTTFDNFTPMSNIQIGPTSPWYIAGLPAVPATGYAVTFSPGLNGLKNIQKPFENVVNHTLDLKIDLAGEWQFNGAVVQGKTTGCGVCGPENSNSFQLTYASTADASLFNPYLSTVQPAGLARLVGSTSQAAELNLKDASARFEGPVMSLPAGELRASIGGEYAYHDHFLALDQNVRNYAGVVQRLRNTRIERRIKSGFAEAYVPLFGAANARAGLQRLDLSLAIRYDNYSDFGGTTNPKVGLTWKPTQSFDVRGTWGKSFRAPTLTESNPGTITILNRATYTNGAGDASIPITIPAQGQTHVLTRGGNSAGLRPEVAKVWSLGADWEPEWLDGLKLSTTYYSVFYQDRIEAVPNPTSALTTPENRALYAPFIVAAPQPATCVPGTISTYNPVYQALFNTPFALNNGSALNDCLLKAYVETGQQNLGDLDQRGLDISAVYGFDTGAGRWQVGATLSKILKLDKSFIHGGAVTDVKNTISFQVDTRATADLNWSRERWSANLKANYIGSYLNNTPITVAGVRRPSSTVPSWTTWDAGLAYAVSDSEDGWLSGTRVSFSVQNLTDKDPNIVLNGVNASDIANANPDGRILGLEISKRF